MRGQLAELFIDLTLRGDKPAVQSLRNTLETIDRGHGKAQSDRLTRQAHEIQNYKRLSAEYGKFGALKIASRAGIGQRGGIANEAMNLASFYQQGRAGGGGVGGMVSAIQQATSMGQLAGMAGAVAGSALVVGAAAAAATVGIRMAMNAASTASPEHAQTLSKSMDLLTAEIGTALLPILRALAVAIQGMARGARAMRQGFNNFAERYNPRTMAVLSNVLNSMIGGVSLVLLSNVLNSMIGGVSLVLQTLSQGPLDVSSNFRSQFTSFEQGWSRIQQEAASGGSLDAQLQRLQLENLPQQTAHLRNIERNTQSGGNAP